MVFYVLQYLTQRDMVESVLGSVNKVVPLSWHHRTTTVVIPTKVVRSSDEVLEPVNVLGCQAGVGFEIRDQLISHLRMAQSISDSRMGGG
jgi:hypothetical protein